MRLAGLARLAGLPGNLVTGRQIAVLARVEDPAAAAGLAARLRKQRLAPAELVVVVAAQDGEPASPRRDHRTERPGRAGREDHGRSRRCRGGRSPGRAGWVPHAAKTARSPWVAPWQTARPQDGDYDESYLLDLACARECAQADAVGYAGGSGYAYVTSLDPALARPGFFGPDGSEMPRSAALLSQLRSCPR